MVKKKTKKAAKSPAKKSKGASKAWNIGLWTLQVLLAALFGMAGFSKGTQPVEALLAQGITWANGVPLPLLRFIGISELAGALGLILPGLFRIRPQLTAWAAAGLATIMLLALPFHLMRGEAAVLPVPLVLGLLAAFVAWGRFKKAPLSGR